MLKSLSLATIAFLAIENKVGAIVIKKQLDSASNDDTGKIILDSDGEIKLNDGAWDSYPKVLHNLDDSAEIGEANGSQVIVNISQNINVEGNGKVSKCPSKHHHKHKISQ